MRTVGGTTYGANLKARRLAAGLTLEALAERLRLKRPGPLSTLETGKKIPKASTIRKHAEALGCSAADLLGGVVTEYDALRGATAPTPASAVKADPLTPIERRALRLLRLTTDVGQRRALGLLSEVARSLPREKRQGSRPRTAETPAGRENKVRGIR